MSEKIAMFEKGHSFLVAAMEANGARLSVGHESILLGREQLGELALWIQEAIAEMANATQGADKN
ncbi:MAG TPA: hypothetical protein PKE16_16425 [Hyphomicrobium sp.]|nr:hypothetical protein [Hyphomicrobium sp.]